MKVILVKPVPKLGNPGDVKEVSPGYGRNFLLARGLARPATQAALAVNLAAKEQREQGRLKRQQKLDKIKSVLAGQTILVRAKANVEGVLFGGVDRLAIAAAIAKRKKIEIDPKGLSLAHHLKTLGRHEVVLNLVGGEQVKFFVDIENV